MGEEVESPRVLEEAQEATIQRLHQQLAQAEEELRAKNEKCDKLAQMQQTVDSEIQELTSSLFQVAPHFPLKISEV